MNKNLHFPHREFLNYKITVFLWAALEKLDSETFRYSNICTPLCNDLDLAIQLITFRPLQHVKSADTEDRSITEPATSVWQCVCLAVCLSGSVSVWQCVCLAVCLSGSVRQPQPERLSLAVDQALYSLLSPLLLVHCC